MDDWMMRSRLSSEQGQVWSWVLGIFLVALVIGAIITQCGPIIANHFNLGSTAKEAADKAASVYDSTRGNMNEVEKAVGNFLEERGARLAGSITVSKGGTGSSGTIYVPVRKIVNTIIFENISYLAPYTEAYAEGQGTTYK